MAFATSAIRNYAIGRCLESARSASARSDQRVCRIAIRAAVLGKGTIRPAQFETVLLVLCGESEEFRLGSRQSRRDHDCGDRSADERCTGSQVGRDRREKDKRDSDNGWQCHSERPSAASSAPGMIYTLLRRFAMRWLAAGGTLGSPWHSNQDHLVRHRFSVFARSLW